MKNINISLIITVACFALVLLCTGLHSRDVSSKDDVLARAPVDISKNGSIIKLTHPRYLKSKSSKNKSTKAKSGKSVKTSKSKKSKISKSQKAGSNPTLSPTTFEDTIRLGNEIPNLGLVGMSKSGHRFADSSNIYEYSETEADWVALPLGDLGSHTILGINDLGTRLLIGLYMEDSQELDLKIMDQQNDTVWNVVTSHTFSYQPYRDLFGRDNDDMAYLTNDGLKVVITGKDGVIVFDVTSDDNNWKQVGQTLPLSRDIATNDDGSQIAISSTFVSDSGSPSIDIFVYELTSDETGSEVEWTPMGQELSGPLVEYYASWSITMSMNSSGNRIAIGAPDGTGRYYNGDVFVYEYDPNDKNWKPLGETVNPNFKIQIFGGGVVKLSGDGLSIAVGSGEDKSYLSYPDIPCCDNDVHIYKLDIGKSDRWEKVFSIKSGSRFSFGSALAVNNSLDRIAIASSEGLGAIATIGVYSVVPKNDNN